MAFALGEHAAAVASARRRWASEDRTRRLWARDASIFSNRDEAHWLGWLELPTASAEVAIGSAPARAAIAAHPADIAVVLGMGGSSLWPAVLGRTWNGDPGVASPANGRRRVLHVLDSTVPDAVAGFLDPLPLERCLFFVSSKSGSTIEPNALYELIHARLARAVGPAAAGRHFVAITDPGSALEARARQAGFLAIALGRADVGGRVSALSPFGLLPAEAMGLDAEHLLARARAMAAACRSDGAGADPDSDLNAANAAAANPGVELGLALATLAERGRDKLTLSLSPGIESFGGWIEQLVAESTGKGGRGILPITGEVPGEPACYASDRVFVDLALAGDPATPVRAARLEALARAGHPVIRRSLADAYDLGGAIFEWELATAVVGSLFEQNPFDQPDVEAAKIASREVMAARVGAGGVGGAPRAPGVTSVNGKPGEPGAAASTASSRSVAARSATADLRIIVPPALEAAVRGAEGDPARILRGLVASLGPGDAFLINVFLAETDAIRAPLERLRAALRASTRVATALSFGPRYLHSTGQLQKGGPNRLAGLQIWQSAAARRCAPLAIPGLGGDFDGLAEAQAVGDHRILAERGRRVLGIDVGSDPVDALTRLAGWIEGALA